MLLSFLGTVFVWCAYPILCLSDLNTSNADKEAIQPSQVNVYLSLASSVLGSYTACAFNYRKFLVHDIIFSVISVNIN
jgi:hypothetical protein